LYVPAARPEIVVLVADPAMEPGLIVQFPDGNPVKITLPVATAHVGCVIVPTVGAAGVTGCVLIVTAVGVEIQVLSAVLLTSILCDPGTTPEKVTGA
jgi:hypothetical protein